MQWNGKKSFAEGMGLDDILRDAQRRAAKAVRDKKKTEPKKEKK